MQLSRGFGRQVTSETRRAALQLAVQLPEGVEEARAVLDQTGHLLEDFLIAAPREVSPGGGGHSEVARPSWLSAAILTFAGVILLSPLGAIAARLTGLEAASGWVITLGVVGSSLVFGPGCAVLFSLVAAVAHNFFAVPPALEFNPLTSAEVLRLVGFVGLSLLVPAIAHSAGRVRRAISSFSCAVRAAFAAGRSRD